MLEDRVLCVVRNSTMCLQKIVLSDPVIFSYAQTKTSAQLETIGAYTLESGYPVLFNPGASNFFILRIMCGKVRLINRFMILSKV